MGRTLRSVVGSGVDFSPLEVSVSVESGEV